MFAKFRLTSTLRSSVNALQSLTSTDFQTSKMTADNFAVLFRRFIIDCIVVHGFIQPACNRLSYAFNTCAASAPSVSCLGAAVTFAFRPLRLPRLHQARRDESERRHWKLRFSQCSVFGRRSFHYPPTDRFLQRLALFCRQLAKRKLIFGRHHKHPVLVTFSAITAGQHFIIQALPSAVRYMTPFHCGLRPVRLHLQTRCRLFSSVRRVRREIVSCDDAELLARCPRNVVKLRSMLPYVTFATFGLSKLHHIVPSEQRLKRWASSVASKRCA